MGTKFEVHIVLFLDICAVSVWNYWEESRVQQLQNTVVKRRIVLSVLARRCRKRLLRQPVHTYHLDQDISRNCNHGCIGIFLLVDCDILHC